VQQYSSSGEGDSNEDSDDSELSNYTPSKDVVNFYKMKDERISRQQPNAYPYPDQRVSTADFLIRDQPGSGTSEEDSSFDEEGEDEYSSGDASSSSYSDAYQSQRQQ